MDKFLHFIAGAAITCIVIVGMYSVGHTLNWPINNFVMAGTGAVAGIIGGIAKEVYDATGHGTPEIGDLIASSMGACTVAALALLILP